MLNQECGDKKREHAPVVQDQWRKEKVAKKTAQELLQLVRDSFCSEEFFPEDSKRDREWIDTGWIRKGEVHVILEMEADEWEQIMEATE